MLYYNECVALLRVLCHSYLSMMPTCILLYIFVTQCKHEQCNVAVKDLKKHLIHNITKVVNLCELCTVLYCTALYCTVL